MIPKARLVVILTVVLISGGVLRLWGIAWGWPHGLWGDEALYMPNAIRMASKGDLNTYSFHNSHLFTYICLAEIGMTYMATLLLGVCRNADEFGGFVWRNATAILLLARLTVATFGVATVYVTYLLGKRLTNATVGLMAASILAFNFLHGHVCHLAINDGVMVFFLTLAALASLAIVQHDRLKDSILCGIFAGVAVGSKYNAGLVLIMPLTAHFMHWCEDWRQQTNRRDLTIKRLTRCGLVFILSGVAFVATNPYSVLDFKTFWEGFSLIMSQSKTPWPVQPEVGPGYPIKILWYGMGGGVVVFSLVGALWLWKMHRPTAVVFLSFPLIYLFQFSLQKLMFPRFMTPMTPFLAVLAACGIICLANRVAKILTYGNMQRKEFGYFALLTILTCVAVWPSASRFIKHDRLMLAQDVRLDLAAWLKENAAPYEHALVEYDAGAAIPAPCVELNVVKIGAPKLVQDWDFQRIQDEEFDYVVVTSRVPNLYRWDPEENAPARRLIEELNSKAQLVAKFSPYANSYEPSLSDDPDYFFELERLERMGPIIYVYRITSDRSTKG